MTCTCFSMDKKHLKTSQKDFSLHGSSFKGNAPSPSSPGIYIPLYCSVMDTLTDTCSSPHTHTNWHTHTHNDAVMVLCEGQADQGDWADWGSVLRR